MLFLPLRSSGALLATALVTATLLPVPAAARETKVDDAPRRIAYRAWDTTAELATGTFAGTRASAGKLRLTTPTGRTTIGRTAYQLGTWTSPSVSPGFGLTELVPSWAASTPEGTLVQVDVRGTSEGGTRSSWDTIGRWARGDGTFRRTSLGSQSDDLARVATDTWVTKYGGFTSWQLRVSLLRRAGSTLTPLVGTVGAMTSDLPAVDSVTTSRPGVAKGVVLDVPRYSQMVHAGEYPQYGGGGEAWCSPTSTSMVLAYYKLAPPTSEYPWVRKSYVDRGVDHAARMTFDHGYDGTGNWPFNTAYAARYTGHAFVTRFASLRDLEPLVKAGIPVVTSITFARGQLSGAPIGASHGHVVVVVGFTSTGDVVVNDPASRTRAGVRRTYDRGQFEDVWLQRYPTSTGLRGSGGLAYVIRDNAHPLPARGAGATW
ncbi:MAG: C39 family peptidase [Nocardioidaceae bacterium]